MNEETERKNRVISGIATALICIGMFLIFWFYNFHYELEVPPPESGEVMVSLGEPDAGGPEEVPVEAESKPSVPTMSEPEAVEQTKDPDAVATKKSAETPKPQAKPAEKPQEDDLLKSLQKGKANQKPANSGEGTKPGSQGDPNGTQGGDPKGTVGGTGKSTGVNHSFKGRVFRQGSSNKRCNEEGKVILDVILMPDGRIRYDGINPASSGSTCLEGVAIDYLKSSSFNASDNPVSVEGTITFIFKLK